METQLFTVVLERPHSLNEAADVEPFENIYVAIGIEAPSAKTALLLAQQEAYAADLQEWGKRAMDRWEIELGQYQLLVMFPGRVQPCAFGFESGMRTR